MIATARVRQELLLPIFGGDIVGRIYTFSGLSDGQEHIAFALGAFRDGIVSGGAVPLVRLHSECLTGDVFQSQKCDCGSQLREAVYRIDAEGGYLLYLRQEGRGIGLYSKIDAYQLQKLGFDTFAANRQLKFPDDLRDYLCAAEMLGALGIKQVRLLSNNPAKEAQLTHHGVSVLERKSTGLHINEHNRRYIEEKIQFGGHDIALGAPGSRQSMAQHASVDAQLSGFGTKRT